MEISFTLNFDDIVAFQRYHIDKRVGRTRKIRMLVAILLLALLIPFWIPVVGGPVAGAQPMDPFPTMLVTVIVTVLLLFLLGQRTWMKWVITKQLRQGMTRFDQRMLLSPKRIVLTPEAMQFESAFWNATYRWCGIAEIAQTPDHLFIYIVSNFAHVMPMRAFASEKSFREFAKAKGVQETR